MKAGRNQTNKKDPRSGKRRGIFITLEGIEGCGKTTQSHRLAFRLRAEGYQVLETREPGGTPLAEEIRTLLLKGPSRQRRHQRLTPVGEAALVFASRSHHVHHIIVPALAQGKIVVCDRFSDSTLAYQGYGRGLGIEELQAFNDFVTNRLAPDLTFVLDLPVKQGLSRRQQTRNQNRLDREPLAFHERVRRGFLALARANQKRIIVINGCRSADQIASEVAATTHHIIVEKLRSRAKPKQRRHRMIMTA